MDLITLRRELLCLQPCKQGSLCKESPGDAGSRFFLHKNRIDRQQSHAADRTGGLQTERIGKRFSEHLIAAANAEHYLPAACLFQDCRL